MDTPVLIITATQILDKLPFMPGTLSRSLLRDITMPITMITASAEMTVKMTILWSVLLTVQTVGVNGKVPPAMAFATRALDVVEPRLLAWMIQECIWMIWRKKV